MSPPSLTSAERELLLDIARQAITRETQQIPLAPLPLVTLPERLQEEGASFVTLTQRGELRGCIGSLTAHRALALDVRENAIAAAFADPRFPPVTPEELEELRIEISILSKPEPLTYPDAESLLMQLRPGVDGVVLKRGLQRATFLPQVWEQLPDPEQFLAQLCYKAGLPANAWRWPQVEISIYQVEKFKELAA